MLRLRVKEIAESRGISRGKLSRMADLSYPTIRDIFADPYRDVPMSTIEKLAKALKVDISQLIEVVPDEEA